MKQKIGVLGTGMVGQVLATGFLDHGHDVMIGTRTPQKLEEWLDKNPTGRVGGHRETGAWADLLVLAAKGSAAETVVRLLDSKDVQGKIIIDATNPLADAPPENGVLKYFTSLENSLMEQLQAAQPGARFVKAFNSVGNAYMVDPKFEEGRPTMFICGNDAEAKGTVAALLNSFGWDAED
ncbi:MAG TPA: NAD(P)-binding domain-containing protein, partial [Flavobacteriales bacterium]|nr:NAD(P)-binding domain-containing protein [Flavobacteriales bacterium]